MKIILNLIASTYERRRNLKGKGAFNIKVISLLIIVISIVVFVIKNDGKLIIDLNEGTIIFEHQKQRLEDLDAI